MWTKESLHELIEEKLGAYQLIVVSNREPFIHRYEGDEIECVQAASGLVSALDPIMRVSKGVWIAHGSGDADRQNVDDFDRVQVPPGENHYTLRRVWLTKEQEERYYYGLCNEGLWPLCHVVFTRPSFDPDDWEAYRQVNALFARATLQEAGDKSTFVFIQDYHFALLPRMLKDSNANLIVAQFWHIPWPNPEVFRAFPWERELLDGLLGNDLLGFHLRDHCQNFLDSVDHSLETKVDHMGSEIVRGGKVTQVRPFPISIDFKGQSARAAGPEVPQQIERWRRRLGLHGEILGIGIDRLDYTKGIPERLRMIDSFLEQTPEYRNRLVFVQVAVPSRVHIRRYQQLGDEIEALVDEINWKWSVAHSRPIILIKEHLSMAQMTALHRMANFCMVSPLHDGMNLVAKEFVASRVDEAGVLILSGFAGAARELTDALVINPFSLHEGIAAIKHALTMPQDERRRRMAKMRETVENNNIYRWAGKFLSALLKFNFPESSGYEPGHDGGSRALPGEFTFRSLG